MAISNTDNHLRNHAFIYEKQGWSLSPLYDINPVPYGDDLSLNVNDDDSRISVKPAIDTAHYFGIKEETAKQIADEILLIVKKNRESLAAKHCISRAKIEDMRPAFHECYIAL